MEQIKIIFWDFDGVIMDSMSVRDHGFVKTLENYSKEEVEQLLEYHNLNGGLSRYVKFRYFFEEIRKEKVTEEQIQELASKFSSIMLDLLINEKLLIQETVEFIKNNYQNYKFHIVSGSDGVELNKICKGLGIDKYFLSIYGSPTHKNKLVADLLEEHKYDKDECILIGDSINDYTAAVKNDIKFYGYGNDYMISKTHELLNFNLFQ